MSDILKVQNFRKFTMLKLLLTSNFPQELVFDLTRSGFNDFMLNEDLGNSSYRVLITRIPWL